MKSGEGFTYDPLGNRTSETDFYGTHTYGYDAIYQLLGDSLSGESFSYDPLGNRLTANASSYTTGSGNRLSSVGENSYVHDNNGNLTSKTVGGVTWTYTWNSLNQLTNVSNTSGLSASFKYDPFGRRIEKNINDTVRRYVYQGNNIRFIYNGDNNLLFSFNHGAGVDDTYRMTDQATGTKYIYLHDGRGSVYQVLNEATLAVVKTYRYDSFGNIISETGDLENPFAYTGREWEPELGLYYYRARWYDPVIGRFISEDPIGFAAGDPNIFRYVFNNPVNLIDPFGLYVNEIFVNGTIGNPFGHSAIEINGKFYDVNKNGSGGIVVTEYTPAEFNQRYGGRGYYSVSRDVPNENAMQEFLDQMAGQEWDYKLFTNNCQTFVNQSVESGEGNSCNASMPAPCILRW